MNLRPCLLLCVTLTLTLLPVLAADPPGKGKGNQGKQTHVSAKIRAGQEKWELTPNSQGIFPRLNMASNAPVEVEMRIPLVPEGTLAVVSVRDGGNVSASVPDDGKGKGKGKGGDQTVTGVVVRPRVQPHGRLQFTFLYGPSLHFQRVTVDIGQRQHVFDFHVHPPQP